MLPGEVGATSCLWSGHLALLPYCGSTAFCLLVGTYCIVGWQTEALATGSVPKDVQKWGPSILFPKEGGTLAKSQEKRVLPSLKGFATKGPPSQPGTPREQAIDPR
jgi:hypothetical protein